MRVRIWTGLSALLVCGVSANAFADTIPLQTDRILSDPANLPMAGQLLGETSYQFGSGNADVYDSTGARTATVDVHTNTVRQAFSYGLTNDLSVEAALDYAPMDRRQVMGGGTTTDYHSSGFHDPELGVTWRAIDEERASPFNLDLFAHYGPDIFDAKRATPTIDGTTAYGGSTVSLGTDISRVTPRYTLMGRFAANYLGDRSMEDQATATPVRYGSAWDYELGLYTQARLDPRWAVDANVSHTFAPDSVNVVPAGGVAHTLAPGDGTTLGAALDYQVIPSRLVASLTYDYDMHDTTNRDYAATPAANTALKGQNENLFGVRFNYAFN
jgi:hypothetical protein